MLVRREGGGGTSLIVSEVNVMFGMGHFSNDVEYRLGSLFQDSLDFGPLHGEQVEKGLGHKSDPPDQSRCQPLRRALRGD
jgi:hypothetical protein